MKEEVLNIVSAFVEVSAADLEARINEEGVWNSLQKVEIVIAIEDEFDITFTQEEIAETNTISQLIDKIQGKI